MFGEKTIHITEPLFYHAKSRKSKDVEIVGAKIQHMNSALVCINVPRMLEDCVEDASIAICGNAKAAIIFVGVQKRGSQHESFLPFISKLSHTAYKEQK